MAVIKTACLPAFRWMVWLHLAVFLINEDMGGALHRPQNQEK